MKYQISLVSFAWFWGGVSNILGLLKVYCWRTLETVDFINWAPKYSALIFYRNISLYLSFFNTGSLYTTQRAKQMKLVLKVGTARQSSSWRGASRLPTCKSAGPKTSLHPIREDVGNRFPSIAATAPKPSCIELFRCLPRFRYAFLCDCFSLWISSGKSRTGPVKCTVEHILPGVCKRQDTAQCAAFSRGQKRKTKAKRTLRSFISRHIGGGPLTGHSAKCLLPSLVPGIFPNGRPARLPVVSGPGWCNQSIVRVCLDVWIARTNICG